RAEPVISDQMASLEAYRQCLEETADIPQFFSYVDTSLDEWCGAYHEANEQRIREVSPTVYVHAHECETYGISGASPDTCLPVSFAGAMAVEVVMDRAADAGLVQQVISGIRARGVQTMILKAALP